MPYIKQDKRAQLDAPINAILHALRGLESDDPMDDVGGNLNYIFTRLLSVCYGQKYSEMAQAVSVLEMAKLEFYRRRAAPYEDQKAFDNGDAFTG